MSTWSCDERNKGSCRNPHGCHCKEIAALIVQRGEATRQRDDALAKLGHARWTLATAGNILEAEGVNTDFIDEAMAAIDAPALTATAAPGGGGNIQNRKIALLRQCYVTLAFAFTRLHQSSRSRDGELCLDFQRVRAQIEKLFKDAGVKL